MINRTGYGYGHWQLRGTEQPMAGLSLFPQKIARALAPRGLLQSAHVFVLNLHKKCQGTAKSASGFGGAAPLYKNLNLVKNTKA